MLIHEYLISSWSGLVFCAAPIETIGNILIIIGRVDSVVDFSIKNLDPKFMRRSLKLKTNLVGRDVNDVLVAGYCNTQGISGKNQMV